MNPIWECYGHGREGTALIMAKDRQHAQQTCREWLNWTINVCFRAADKITTYTNCGGNPLEPVVFAIDDVHYTRIHRPYSHTPIPSTTEEEPNEH